MKSPKHIVVITDDGGLRLIYAYSDPVLGTFTNGGWVTFLNDTGHDSSVPLDRVKRIHALHPDTGPTPGGLTPGDRHD